MLTILSLGAGVQSTTMALMAAHGEIEPMPTAAIFADTHAEPATVYNHLAWLRSPNVLPFPVHIVSGGDLRQKIVDAMAGRARMDSRPPFFTERGGPINRQCTTKHKIEPIKRRVRELMKEVGAESVEQWIGISTDEASRMKPARDVWQINRWPLIEKRMSRIDCLAWLDRHGYPRAPKSACTFCPYRNTEHWRRMKADDKASWNDAVAIDRLIRNGLPQERSPHKLFVHYSGRPLEDVDFSTPQDRGQIDLFNNECEGMCGV
jgi:hypothetical protein